MSKKSKIEELRSKRIACSCGHKLFIIVPKENGELGANCFMCGEEKYVVVTASQMSKEIDLSNKPHRGLMRSYQERDGKNAVYCYACNNLWLDPNGYPIGHTKTHCCGQVTETIIPEYLLSRLGYTNGLRGVEKIASE